MEPLIIPTSVTFNFDGTASESLQAGEIYQWKLYADFYGTPGVQQLISASEDLMGIFKIP
jgi:hypothetical protein